MDVRDAMTRGAETIAPGATLQEAARKMRAAGVGALPVCEDERPVGMLTDRDIVVRATAAGADPTRATVREAMTPLVVSCHEEDDLYGAAHRMEEHAIRRLMVVDAGDHLTGLLSVDDLAIVSRALAAEVIEQTREPRAPEALAPSQPLHA